MTVAAGTDTAAATYPQRCVEPIDRRGLFSRITGNRRGRPPETYQTVVGLLATTVTGLTAEPQ